jgi:CRP-like cAMP-binding protein
VSIVGKWPDFAKFVQSELERREVCARITVEDFRKGEIIAKQGEEPDGWYLIFSGQCSLFVSCQTRDETAMRQIPAHTLAALRAAFGSDKSFVQVGVKGPTEEFGNASLSHAASSPATVICDKSCLILRTDPVRYREIVEWVARSQLEKKAVLLSQIKELQLLHETRDLYMQLAEYLEPIRFEAGTVIDAAYFRRADEGNAAFVVVEEGLFVKRRVVDFTRMKQSRFAVPICMPEGTKRVRVAEYGPTTMFPDPAMKICVSRPFTVFAETPVSGYLLKVQDLVSMLLKVQAEKVLGAFRGDPDDDEVAQLWIAREEATTWTTYKKSCSKEARRAIKTEKAVLRGEWAIRKPAPPKPIKEHGQFAMLSPREYEPW